jgi:hypothetical protein
MIVSFARNFIFLKTRKTGGTSIEIALTPNCGVADILTPISVEDELLRLVDGRVAARNYATPAIEAAAAKAVLAGDAVAFRDARIEGRHLTGFRAHMPAAEMQKKLSVRFWAEALKFTVERHPYERIVSTAFFRGRSGKTDALARIDECIEDRAEANEDIYRIAGASVVDRVLRQEFLESDLSSVADKLGLSIPLPMPRAKSAFRSDRRPAHDILSQDQKDRIYRSCRATFEMMGYER